MKNVLFLPGAGGEGRFWQPVIDRLPTGFTCRSLDWPGLGAQPADPGVRGLADLVTLAERAMLAPSVIVAQSMGGIVALQLALAHPARVRGLVLVATSGGLDVSALGAQDWRAEFLATYPRTARWILDVRVDLAPALPTLQVPTLIISGRDDPISPVAVGERLQALIPGSRRVVLPGDHAVGRQSAPEVARLITGITGFTDT
jgi:pimeloyl-ACP methyl ester carboxylesterase